MRIWFNLRITGMIPLTASRYKGIKDCLEDETPLVYLHFVAYLAASLSQFITLCSYSRQIHHWYMYCMTELMNWHVHSFGSSWSQTLWMEKTALTSLHTFAWAVSWAGTVGKGADGWTRNYKTVNCWSLTEVVRSSPRNSEQFTRCKVCTGYAKCRQCEA